MDLVTINNGQAVTTSMKIAEYFGKKHQHVMEKIRKLLDELPSEWGVSNFRQSSYFNVQGKEQPCYEMTKDGFTLLAMGFTGKKAIEFKINYINAFNQMADFINGKSQTLTQQLHQTQQTYKLEFKNASISGTTLAKWKRIKKQLTIEMVRITKEMQLILPFVEFESKAV